MIIRDVAQKMVVVIVCVLAIVSTVNARQELLLVDFNGHKPGDSTDNAAMTYTGSGMFGFGVWNGVQVSTFHPEAIEAYYPDGRGLVYADGTPAAGISIKPSAFAGSDAYDLNGGLLYGDYIDGIDSNNPPKITLSGLVPHRKYDLGCYSHNGDPRRIHGVGASWTANGVGPLNLFKHIASKGVLYAVPADANGVIVIQLGLDMTYGFAIVNGFELRPTPAGVSTAGCPAKLPEDLNFDCVVNFEDVIMLAMRWIESDAI